MFYNIRTPLCLCLLLALVGIVIAPSTAQAQNRDSSHYLSDDGVFSDEEKDAEAEIIKQRCEIGTLTRIYYNCTCIAGAFRQKRDEPELTPQAHIINDLYNDTKSKCVDPVKIAGNAYQSCSSYAKFFRTREDNDDEYCKCVANKTSKDFTLEPKLKSKHINKIKLNAMTSCERKMRYGT